ncbi:dnm1l [Symbiodinium sp. KB8]|nr:dnm1l [Symbiodinium sp. KB8]
MEASTTSPQQRGYNAEDLESQGENGTSDGVEDSEDDSESTPKATRDASTSQLHPDDSSWYWYETTVRLRCIFFVFFSLAIVLAVALGSTTECGVRVRETWLQRKFVPAFLLVSAIYVDECIDMGLLGAIVDRCPGVVARPGHSPLRLPIIFAIVTVVFADMKVYWYKDFARGYCLGGLVFAMLVCITYILCHIYVGHNPERDEMMAITYHNMGPLGRFKRVNKRPDKPLVDARPHWGRSVLYFLIGLSLEVLVVILFIILHDFFTAPGLAEQAFTAAAASFVKMSKWAGIDRGMHAIFAIALFSAALPTEVGLLMGTLASASVGRRGGKLLEPLVLGPMAPGYGAKGGSFNDLPQNFTVSAGSPHLGYPICSTVWRYPGTPTDPPEERGLDILDLSVLAYASSFFDEADVRPESYPLHQSKV